MSSSSESCIENFSDAEREAIEQFTKAASECCGGWGEQFRSLTDSAGKFVREKPVQSIMIAAGVGLLVGLVIRRR